MHLYGIPLRIQISAIDFATKLNTEIESDIELVMDFVITLKFYLRPISYLLNGI